MAAGPARDLVADDGRPLSASFVADLVGAWGAWSPTLSPDGDRVAYVSDRSGTPALWVDDVAVALSNDPVLTAHWSGDGKWLACAVATDGGVRSEVWVVRSDGTDARLVAGGTRHARLGPWTRVGCGLVVALAPQKPGDDTVCVLIDPETGGQETLAVGGLVDVLDLSDDGRIALLRDGTRGSHFCVALDRELDVDHPLLPYPGTGSTDAGMLRPLPDGGLVAYLVSDAGRPRRELLAAPLGPDGIRGQVGTVAGRADAELEFADADDSGTLAVLVWNVDGASEVELLDLASGERRPLPQLPGAVVSGCVMVRDGSCAMLSVEGPAAPRRLWRLWTATGRFEPVGPSGRRDGLVEPSLERFVASDGLPLSGWLYRVPGRSGPGPAMLSLHGGPEAQERPTFSPQHQAMVAAGIAVFAPNVRGSSGFGRSFEHADDRYGRWDAIADVASCADHLISLGVADPGRIAVTGRSYGGYLTLVSLVRHQGRFAAGVDICGMSDLQNFYRETEPWIAAAAVTKYGDPASDGILLHELSPLHHAHLITAPLLVVHGEHDTNVPIGEARRIVAAVRAAGGDVDYLELAGEGHEYRRAASRITLIDCLIEFLSAAL